MHFLYKKAGILLQSLFDEYRKCREEYNKKKMFFLFFAVENSNFACKREN